MHNIRYLLYIDPEKYAAIESEDRKRSLGRMVGKINRHPAVIDGKIIMMGPGRWGSSNINLGVNVGYSDIDNTSVLVEMAREERGHIPEVSYGTHFFQDLVEADIEIVPLFPDDPGSILNEPFLLNSDNLLARLAPEVKNCEKVVRVIHVPSACGGDYLHLYLDADSQQGIGFFGAKEEEG